MKLSLKTRLALLVALGTAVLTTLTSYGIWTTLRDSHQNQIDTMLRSPGRRLTERTGWNTNWQRFDQSLSLVFGDSWAEDGICRVVGHGPKYPVYYESNNWPEDILIQHPEGQNLPPKPKNEMAELFQVRDPLIYDFVSHSGQHWRMINLANSDLTMHLGIKINKSKQQLEKLATWLVGGSITLTALMFILTWFVARQSLRPVASIARQAQSISARQLDLRVDPSPRFDSEFSQLVTVFNEMIDRLERSFLQSSRFSADASHELKTPITNLFAEVTSRLNQCEPGSEEQLFLANMVQELKRIRSVLGGLLLLSQADSGLLELSRENMDLGPFLHQLCDDYTVLAEETDLEFSKEIFTHQAEGDFMFSGDPVMLSQAFHNLLRNAIHYNRERGQVILRAERTSNGDFTIRIRNSGPPIQADLRSELFERFRKGPEGGHGLGLNIAREIIEAHGGKLELEQSKDDHTVFLVSLPAG